MKSSARLRVKPTVSPRWNCGLQPESSPAQTWRGSQSYKSEEAVWRRLLRSRPTLKTSIFTPSFPTRPGQSTAQTTLYVNCHLELSADVEFHQPPRMDGFAITTSEGPPDLDPVRSDLPPTPHACLPML
eukprot:2633347-Rhodomonas_salina.1